MKTGKGKVGDMAATAAENMAAAQGVGVGPEFAEAQGIAGQLPGSLPFPEKVVHRENKVAIDNRPGENGRINYVAYRMGYDTTERDVLGFGDSEVEALISLLKAEDDVLQGGVPKNPVVRFAEIYAELKDVDAKDKALKAEKDDMEQLLLDHFTNMGANSMTVTVAPLGKPVKVTVYLSEEIWASAGGDKQAACDALKANGLGSYVSEGFNSQSLSAYVREQIKTVRAEKGPGIEFDDIVKVALPQQLLDTLNITNGFKPKARSGK